MKLSKLARVSSLALATLLSINVHAGTNNGLQIDSKFDSCKSTIEEAFPVLQSFNKEFNIDSVLKASESSDKSEQKMIKQRLPVWNLMKSLGADANVFSKEINKLESCEAVLKLLDKLEEAID